MVNRGRPSKDCFPCRKRKLRCDLRPDGCGQCLRADLICSGYRDLSQLAFRDETRATKLKVLARQAEATSSEMVRPATLQLGWDVRARYAFFSIYVMGLSKSCGALAPLYSRAATAQHFHASVDAVSLAFMACHLESPELMRSASEQYLLAIRSLARALRDPRASTSDETLQSVLLLDLYEKMVTHDIRNSTSWMSHVLGAMSLVKARGRRNFSDPVTCELTSRAVITATISCAAAGIQLPEVLVVWRKALNLTSFVAGPKWDFTAVLGEVIKFGLDFKAGKIPSPASVAAKAKALDKQMARQEALLPPSWKARRVYTMEPDTRVFGRYYDAYPTHFATQVRNGIWVNRLIMNDMARRHDSAGHGAGAAKAIAEITRQICAAVPQFILPDARDENSVPFSPLQRLQCYTLLAPLHLAGRLSTDTYMQSWINDVIDHMADVGGIKMARDVADISRMQPDIDFWAVYAMTGSYALAA